MAVSVLLSGTLKDGLVDQFSGICTEAFHVTRAYDGCQNINLTLHVEDPHKFVLTEVWDSKEHYEKYALKDLLALISPKCNVIQVNEITEGAACTTTCFRINFTKNRFPLI